MTAVDNIIAGRVDKENIWALNTEMEYHETKEEAPAARQPKADLSAAPADGSTR